jgi:hypothetical protein
MAYATQGSLLNYCHILALYLGLSDKGVSESGGVVEPMLRSSESTSFGSTSGSPMACKSDCAGNGRVPSTYLVCGASHIDELSSCYHPPQQTPSSTDNSTSSNMKSRPQCSRCLSTFSTISNVNKHMKTDCKYGNRIHFSCRNRGCKRRLTRVEYRNIHEKERCPFKTLTCPTIST